MMRRDEVAALLWPEVASDASYSNLRHVLFAIRKWSAENDIQLMTGTREWISWAPPGLPLSDLELLLAPEIPTNEYELGQLLAFAANELLKGHEGIGEEFDQWLFAKRRELQAVLLEKSLRARPLLSTEIATSVLEVMAEHFPTNQRLMRARMENFVFLGRREEAEAMFQSIGSIVVASSEFSHVRNWHPPIFPESLASALSGARQQQPRPSGHFLGLPRVLLLPPDTQGPSVSRHNQVMVRSLVTEVMMTLGKMRTFAMIAPFSAKQMDPSDPIVAAAALGADYVVSTHLLGDSASGRSFVGFSLIHPATHSVLIADKLPLQLNTLGIIEGDLAEAIAAAVSSHIAETEVRQYRRTGEATAFTHYLLGQERLTYDLRNVRKARSHFRRSSSLSPNFAAAHAMTARTLTYEWLVLGRPEPDLLQEALVLATKAAQMDPLQANGHWEIGHALMYMQRLEESLSHVETALTRSPHVADLLADKADVFIHLNEGRKAKDTILQAIELNPLPPDDYHWVLGSADFLLQDYRATLTSFQKMKNNLPVARLMAACYAMLGERQRALHHRDRWLEQYPDFKVADWVKLIPMKDTAVAEQIVDAMRHAGFS